MKVLIVDSAPIIKSLEKLPLICHNLVTIPEVIHELKDKKTRELLTTCSFEIQQRQPSEAAIKKSIFVFYDSCIVFQKDR